MDMPGRQELRKTYEELPDEILIEIATNTGREYEDAAAEVARTALDNRGVSIPGAEEDAEGCDIDGHSPRGRKATAESVKWYGEKLTGPLVEIPRFAMEESVEIEGIFAENNIPHEKRAVTIAVGPAGGNHEYLFYVPRDSLNSAVEILKQYYLGAAEVQSSGYYSGECPACGTRLDKVEACSDCGLTLAGDYSEFLGGHPFFIFLKNNRLLQ